VAHPGSGCGSGYGVVRLRVRVWWWSVWIVSRVNFVVDQVVLLWRWMWWWCGGLLWCGVGCEIN